MKVRITVVVLFGLAALGAFCVADANVKVLAQTNSQWDGVYSEDQAKRGEALYAENCSSCHGPEMNGGEMAPSLTGSGFLANWNDMTLGDLFERVRISMPQNNPGSLSRQQNADIIAAILKKANYPAGKAELPARTEMLNMYKFLASKP